MKFYYPEDDAPYCRPTVKHKPLDPDAPDYLYEDCYYLQPTVKRNGYDELIDDDPNNPR